MSGLLILFVGMGLGMGLGFGLGVSFMALSEFDRHLDLNGGEDE